MEIQKMTIHRALAELKLIDAKIKKAIEVVDPICLMQNGRLSGKYVTKEEFEKNATSKYMSADSLIKRKIAIKSAIVKANATRFVKIGAKEMTIADAIDYKKIIELKQEFVTKLSSCLISAKSKYNIETEKIKKIALDNAKIMLGKQDDNNVKATDEDVKNIIDPFVTRNQIHIIDPLDLETLVEAMQSEIDYFKTEIDATLSEINALTIIEVKY